MSYKSEFGCTSAPNFIIEKKLNCEHYKLRKKNSTSVFSLFDTIIQTVQHAVETKEHAVHHSFEIGSPKYLIFPKQNVNVLFIPSHKFQTLQLLN